MSRTIRIDLDVWNVLEHSKEPCETKNDTVKRLLGIKANSATRKGDAVEIRSSRS